MIKRIFLLFLIPFFVFSNEDVLKNYNVSLESPHYVQILEDGISSLELRLDLIESAKESIEIEYFIYNTDRAGRILTQALLKAAERGVRVRLLLDHFMIGTEIDPFHSHELEKRGIEVRFYNTEPLIKIVKAQYRDHRKAFIVDGKHMIVGGRNIANEYFDLSPVYNFVDRDVYVRGDIIKNVLATFNHMWESKPVERVERPKLPEWSDSRYARYRRNRQHRAQGYHRFKRDRRRYIKNVKEAIAFVTRTPNDDVERKMVEELGTKLLKEEFEGTCNKVSFVSDIPGIKKKERKQNRILRPVMLERMKAVKEKIVIDSPYFIVDKYTRPILEKYFENNTFVRLLTNGLYSTDAFYVASVFNTFIKKWIRKGLNAFIYKGDVIRDYPTVNEEISQSRWGTHSKSFIFDNDSSMIGSYNFDPRSNVFSLEMGFFCDENKEFAGALERLIDERLEHSYELVDIETHKKTRHKRVGFFKRLIYHLTAPIAIMLKGLL